MNKNKNHIRKEKTNCITKDMKNGIITKKYMGAQSNKNKENPFHEGRHKKHKKERSEKDRESTCTMKETTD